MDVTILKDIVIILALSSFVNFIFTKLKIPTIIGYLLTGIVSGPYVLGLIHGTHDLDLMAEIGVILLMFTIGMEFSLNHLLKIRKTVFLGGFLQLILTTGVVALVSHSFELSWRTSLFLGFLTSLSSTAVVLKILQERGDLTSNYGQTVLGILIFQDIIIIPMLLFIPMLGGQTVDIANELWLLAVKTVFIIVFVFVGYKWLMPRMLHAVAFTKNQELFLMFIFLVCLSVALMTASLGMSLAFGAFLAGLMVSESEYSHNAFGHLIPFKDTFTSFFFVTIGMLLDVHFVLEHYRIVLFAVFLVLFIKSIFAGSTAFVLGHTFRGTIMVGIALSQVGEFSFIIAKTGMEFKLLSDYFYQLFLSVTIITMSVSPFVILIAKPMAERLLKLPIPKILVDGMFPLQQIQIPTLQNHLVLIGKDRRSTNLASMAQHLQIPYISIVFDPVMVKKRQEKGEMVIYGDATNIPILEKAYIETAEVAVVSVGDLITSMAIVDKIRQKNKHIHILVRSTCVENIESLYTLGANQVIPEEFETSIQLFERVMKKFLFPQMEIDHTLSKIRDDNYGFFYDKQMQTNTLLAQMPNLEIAAFKVNDYQYMIGKSIKEMKFRNFYEVTLVAIKRGDDIVEHPDTNELLKFDDIAYIMGKPSQVKKALEMFSKDKENPKT